MGSQCRSVVDAFVNALLSPDIQYPNGRQAAVANARATNLPMGQRYRLPRNNGRNGAIRFAGIVRSARRAGRCIARRNGCHGLDRENRVGLREICRVSRREISQAGRDALALARLAFSFLAHPGSRKYGGGSCNPSVLRSYFCAGLARVGRHGEAAWCGQEDTGGTRAAFRAGGRQLAFRHRSQLCKRPALLAHIFVRRHRPPAFGQNASCSGPVHRDCGKPYQLTGGL